MASSTFITDFLGPGAAMNVADLLDSAFGLAATGTTQRDALHLTRHRNFVATVASGAGVLLWVPLAGDRIQVINRGTSSLLVYPPVGHQLEAYGVNNPVLINSGNKADFDYAGSLAWIVS